MPPCLRSSAAKFFKEVLLQMIGWSSNVWDHLS
jgi:hypothetical protein